MRQSPLLSVVFAAASLVGAVSFPVSTALADDATVRVQPAHVSPNDDDIQDQAFFYPVVQSQVGITRWRLDVARAGGGRVARLSGAGLPALVNWDCVGKKGIVPDGLYEARLEVWGRKTHLSGKQTFAVDTAPPEVSLSLSTPVIDASILSGAALSLAPGAADATPIERWQVQILDETGRTVFLEWSTGTPRAVEWTGADRATGVLVPQGRYQAAFQAWDAAGNQSEPTFAAVTVAVTAREMLERTLQNIQVTETTLGLLVQVESEKLFDYRRGKVVLRPDAETYLREMALLANAYPKATLSLEGYSKAYKSAEKDRELASLYGWQTYSHLVKKGNVKASRITVRGRGRSATFARREAGVPFIRNGVEMIIEGNGPW